MGLFSNIVRFFRGHADAAPAQTSSSPLRSGSATELLLPVGSAPMCVAAVYRCVNLLSESVANLPMQYLRLKGDIYTPFVTDRLHYLLTVQPDYAYSAYDFWKQLVNSLILQGNAYIVPVYSAVTPGTISRLVLCKPYTVVHDTTNDTYTVVDADNGINGVFREDEIIHIKGYSLDGKRGISVLTHARLTLDIANTGDRETLKRFANGGNVRGIVSNDTTVRGYGEYSDKQLEKVAESMDKKVNDNGERIIAMPGMAKFDSTSLTSVDMQFLESRKFTVRDICRFFGVHPSFVFDDTSNNYKSAEMANVAFLSNTLNPLLRCIESEFNRKLIAPPLIGKRRLEFDRRSIYACDLDSEIKYQSQRLSIGAATVNELRREKNMPPVAGGDTVLVSANLKNINEFTTQPIDDNDDKNQEDEDNDEGQDTK